MIGELSKYRPESRVCVHPESNGRTGAALEQLLEEQRDPSSIDYQHWLTPKIRRAIQRQRERPQQDGFVAGIAGLRCRRNRARA